tara:strand:+ start:4130 stop:6478 length:2349 start_codon:yes stop_codon:yes gene_type:complete
MPTVQKIDFPSNNEFHSVYSPLKLTIRVSGGDADGLTDTVEDFVSCRFHFTPYNETTDQWLNNNNNNSYTNTALPNETFAVHVPYTPFVHGWSIDSTPNSQNTPASTGATYRYFTLDCAPLMRNYLSYNLRPCSHDTDNPNVERDITLGQIAYNLFTYYQISYTPEYIDTTGKLVRADGGGSRPDLKGYCYPRVINSALSYNEEIFGYHGQSYAEIDGSYENELQHSVINKIYLHDSNVNENLYGRMKYLSVKPQNRIIGVDECEYLTFAAKNGTDGVYATVTFYDFDGNVIGNGDGSGYYGVNINATANGDGTSTSNGSLFSYGNGGNANPTYAVIQIGVGTRNIKELAITNASKFRNSQPLSDFSNVAYYEVETRKDSTPYDQIGQTIRYTIDHKRRNYNESTRFHWQCRLGGIDSYTFDGAMSRGLQTSSSTYQQTVYPKFRGQLSASDSSTKLFRGSHIQQTTASDNGGAVIPRISGLTDDQYPSIRKHTVDAYGNGSATTRPITFDERQMVEDMMMSSNVWVERGWRAKEIFKEDFGSYSSVSEISNNWNVDSGNLTTDGAFFTDEGHITGTQVYRKGNNSGNDQVWAHSKTKFKYDKNKLYEVEIRYKSSDGDSDAIYCGLTGFAADKTTFVNQSGANSFSSQYYITLENVATSSDDTYRVNRGYISGFYKDGGSYGASRNRPIHHAFAHKDVRFFAAMFLLNHSNTAGRTFVDYIKVTEYSTDDPSQSQKFSSMNRNYYVPVLIKDGNLTSYDSEQSTTVTVDYVESRKKRAIIT